MISADQQHFKNLLSIAYIDGILDKTELEYLFTKTNRFFITEEDFNSVIENGMRVEPMKITDENDRAKKLFELVEMMLLDGEVDERELRLCIIFGVSLGYNAERIEERIDQISSLLDQGMGEDAIIQEIIKFN